MWNGVPDGTLLATTSGNLRSITIHDAATLEIVRVLDGYESTIRDIAWGQAGLASVAFETILVWEPETGMIVEEIQAGGDVLSLAWDTDGERLAFWPDDSPTLQIAQFPTATPSPTAPAVSEDATPADLRRLLSDPGCQAACFLGIEPGVTLPDEIETIFEATKREYYVGAPLPDDPGLIYTISDQNPADQLFPFSGNYGQIAVNIVDNQVANITLIDVEGLSISDVLEAFGQPSRIVQGLGSYDLVYSVERLQFRLSGDPMNVFEIHLMSPDDFESTFNSDLVLDIFPCTEPAEICTIATATPSPTAPAVSEETTPADLRRLLSDPGCQAACFLGIEPDMAATEMEEILAGLGVEYRVDTMGLVEPLDIVYRAYVAIPDEFAGDRVGLPISISIDPDGKIAQLYIPIQVAVAEMVKAFGNPTFSRAGWCLKHRRIP